uniref:hypothetical protein n=1 Tax=Pseudomonas urethralis TaxID=2740517 RepID=UPI001CA57E44
TVDYFTLMTCGCLPVFFSGVVGQAAVYGEGGAGFGGALRAFARSALARLRSSAARAAHRG